MGMRSNVIQREAWLAAAIVLDPDGCWRWPFALDTKGYACGFVNGRTRAMHRVVYERLSGPIPVGAELDHLCRNRSCVNPAHLEPVTHRENTLRGDGWGGQNARKTHCPAGHPYDEEHTIRWVNPKTGARVRMCRTCIVARTNAARRLHGRRCK